MPLDVLFRKRPASLHGEIGGGPLSECVHMYIPLAPGMHPGVCTLTWDIAYLWYVVHSALYIQGNVALARLPLRIFGRWGSAMET